MTAGAILGPGNFTRWNYCLGDPLCTFVHPSSGEYRSRSLPYDPSSQHFRSIRTRETGRYGGCVRKDFEKYQASWIDKKASIQGIAK